MTNGLAAEYAAQVDWSYNQTVVHPLAARREHWRRELRRVQPARSGWPWRVGSRAQRASGEPRASSSLA